MQVGTRDYGAIIGYSSRRDRRHPAVTAALRVLVFCSFSCYIFLMSVTQTVEIPVNHRLTIDVPPEIPAGRAEITFTPKAQVREQDETEYLCSSPANRERLEKAIDNIKQGKNIISFDTLEQAIDCAEKRAASQ
jgi:hypothetical protein